jgi:hypothetical protein
LASRQAGRIVFPVRRRGLHFAILIFQALWLNVIVPGHQRGIVQLRGSEKTQPAACPYCTQQQSTPKNGKPLPPEGNCAICFFAAHLSVPPVTDLSLQPLQLLHRLSGETAKNLFSRLISLPFDGRGPPATA